MGPVQYARNGSVRLAFRVLGEPDAPALVSVFPSCATAVSRGAVNETMMAIAKPYLVRQEAKSLVFKMVFIAVASLLDCSVYPESSLVSLHRSDSDRSRHQPCPCEFLNLREIKKGQFQSCPPPPRSIAAATAKSIRTNKNQSSIINSRRFLKPRLSERSQEPAVSLAKVTQRQPLMVHRTGCWSRSSNCVRLVSRLLRRLRLPCQRLRRRNRLSI